MLQGTGVQAGAQTWRPAPRGAKHDTVLDMRTSAIVLLLAAVFGANGQTLRDWRIQSTEKVTEAGSLISTAGYQPRDWYTATVPATVVSTLVDHKIYPDPYVGMNLRSYPGVSYGIGQNFSNIAM